MSLLRTLLFCGGSITGIYGYSQRRLSTNSTNFHQYNARCESNENINTNTTNDTNESLIPSFRSLLFYKMWNFDFVELYRPEVLIELLLIGCPLLVGAFGSYKMYTRSLKALKHRQFHSTINVTLNTITRNGSIKGGPKHYNIYFRTLMEKELNHIIPNEEGIKLLIKAAKSTNTQQPFIKIENEHTYWTMCNYFANQISSLSSGAFLHRDILSQNNCVISEPYLMILSSEPPTANMNYKIRVQLIKKAVIEQLIKDSDFFKENNNEMDIEWKYKLNNIALRYRWMIIGEIKDIYMEEIRNSKIQTDFDAIMQYDKSNVLNGWNRGCVTPPDYK
eukprot:444758_1